jgi:hypothetical protein
VVRQGSLVILCLLLTVLRSGSAIGQLADAVGAIPTPIPTPAPAPATGVDRLPYRIAAHVAIDLDSRIDAAGRDRLLGAWRAQVVRFVGAPWDLTVVADDRAVAGLDLETVEPVALASLSADFDKVWLIRVRRERAGWALAGRELDTATGRLGPTYRRPAPLTADLPRSLLMLSESVFRPSAVIGEPAGGGVALTVRAASLRPATPFGQVVKVGTVFRPIRIVTLPDDGRRVLDIPFTYLRIESLDGPQAHCAIHSSLRDPLTRRIAQKNTVVALGSKPGPYPTRLRFLARPDKAPAAGYRLYLRPLPDGVEREVGTTDRDGRIALAAAAGAAEGRLALRLLGGSVEPLVEFPLMPGESSDERTLPPIDTKDATIALETQLDTLRDAVIDLVAVRARLEARLKARLEGEDWAGMEAALNEYSGLAPKDTFARRLASLRESAERQQARTKSAILTRTAQAQFAEIDGLLARYLDDDAFRAYADALAQHRAAAARPAPKAPGTK